MHKRTTAAIGAVMVAILATGVVLASHQYPDVPDSNKYHNDIDWLTTNGIAFGYENGNFGPGDDLTRGQMAAFLHRYDTNVAPAAPEYAVVTVFVDRGSGPSRWAIYSAPLGSPAGTTVSGDFRFSCSGAQAPCKISYGAAVVSDQDGDAAVHPRLLIHKDAPTTAEKAPIVICESVDGANNNAGLATIPRVPTLQDAVTEMQTPLGMGIGGSLDCGSTQPYGTGTVTELWVPAASATDTAYYDVAATFTFGLTLDLPPGE